jgi:plastocyanin
MPRELVSAMFCLGLLAVSAPAVYAHGSEEVVVKQGDTIEWIATGGPPHRVRFGADGASSVAEINNILENFSPALTPAPTGGVESPGVNTGTILTAKVKDTAVPDATFIFVCGVHPGPMLSLPFKVEPKVAGLPPRTHRIFGGPGLGWHVHVDTTP